MVTFYAGLLGVIKKDEMLSRVFWTTVKEPLKNDWILTVKENLNELGLDDDLEIIGNKKKHKFKKEIRKAIKIRAHKYLLDTIERKNLKKINNIIYTSLDMQKYILV